VLDQLASLSAEEGDYALAQRLSDHAIAVLDEFDPEERVTRAHFCETLSEALAGAGRAADAKQLLSQSIAVFRECRGPEHRETRKALARLESL
jgi:hypothetical protein